MQFKDQVLRIDTFDAVSLLTHDICEVSLWKDGCLKATHSVNSVEEAKKLIEDWKGEVSLEYSGL